MKFTHKLCGVALLATISTGALLPVATYAAEDPLVWSNNGKIKFTEDDGDDVVLPPGGEDVDPKNPITQPPVNPGVGPLKVIAITGLDFDVNKVTPATSNGWEYVAKPAAIEYQDGTKATSQNFVQFKDTRADNQPNTHKLTAVASTFKNAEGAELKSATLNFSNIKLTNSADPTKVNENAAKPTNSLATDGVTPTEFVNQDDIEKGFGQFSLDFGDETTMGDSVKLNIPASNKLSTSSEYVSTITWTIADAR
ncbi:WxL domain-containing protein [Enterococcus sp. DIV0242_7C1]|uniref:WxL domain-containing protein n=1 Tax=Candidatus Enterococcus dunnyi TaxID=1834192 RepID=A0A200JBP0_9ENTE|nr:MULTISPECIES: WxL domain-containing protein [unclassified Enterococcus]MBO0471757.1 WxL domain-containing protein [Enterococcus sp. DIV0242_7C1]OUZ34614.1 hypothetical protein A5889_000089 [Enterococcus sp. 9D6_DIV0238]